MRLVDGFGGTDMFMDNITLVPELEEIKRQMEA